MTNSDEATASAAPASKQAHSSRGNMRDLFPGYYPPTEDDVKTFVTDGLIVLDTNALLNIYRFTDQARTEYLDTLRLLKDRLWVPHHVGYEFFENRTDVIRDCATANDTLAAALNMPFDDARALIHTFADYRNLSETETETLTQILDAAATQILDKLNEIYAFNIDPGVDPRNDPLLHDIEALLEGKIGHAFSEKEASRAVKDGRRRINNSIPPGYADRNKGEDRAIGDYLLWAQTIEEAKRRQLPVLLVTNDGKEDWVHLDGNRALGPRTELILEMREKADQNFHLVTVQMFLVHARKHLSAHVSDSTVDQAAPARHIDAIAVDVGSTDGDTLRAAQGVEAQLAAISSQLAVNSPADRLAAELAKASDLTRVAHLAVNSPVNRLAAELAKKTNYLTRVAQLAKKTAVKNPSETVDDPAADDAERDASAEE